MRRTQKQKAKAAKRPREKFIYFYKEHDGWTRFELDNKEQGDAWSQFCRGLDHTPNKTDYEYFIKTNK